MPSGGDRSDKYAYRRKISGRLALENADHENALHLLAEGNDREQVVQMMEGKVTAEEIDQLLASPLGARRFQFIQQQKARDEFEPSSPDECLSYVKQRLVKLSRDAEDDKQKIEALKALARVAIDERQNKPAAAAPKAEDDAGLKELREAFGGGDDTRDRSIPEHKAD